jgi:hypothetical protein
VGKRGKVTREGFYHSEDAIHVTPDREAAQAIQELTSGPKSRPLKVAVNVGKIFDPNNSSHVRKFLGENAKWLKSVVDWMRGKRGLKKDHEAAMKLLDDVEAELARGEFAPDLAQRVAEEIETLLNDLAGKRVARDIPSDLQMLDPTQGRIVEDVATAQEKGFQSMATDAGLDFAGRLQRHGWEGYKTTDPSGAEIIGIFDPAQVKMVEDQSGEYAFSTTHRPFGTVSGTFGARLPTDPYKGVPTGADLRYMPASDSPDLPYKVSTRNPTAVNASENPLTSDLVIGLEAIEADPKMLHSHAFALQEYPGVKRTSRSPKVIAEKFIDHVVDNLLWLYDQVAPEVRKRSRLWYDGARRIVDRWSEEFGSTYKTIGGTRSTAREKRGIAAALAALSPQKDWFMNVDLVRRVLDVMTFKKRERFDSAMVDKYVEKFSESLGRKEASKIANAMKGKTLEELPTNYEQAAFIRAYDEVYNPREYQIVSPEGDFIGIARKQNGEPDSVAWGSMKEIAKAVRVLRDPSRRNISEALGKAHKIRNFYNNILLPKADKLSVTIDTHAIAAALLRALAGHDLEVANNFGVKPKGAKRSIKNSSVTGIHGTYGIYADAYRKAAEARGVLPREMQSITWEAIRGLFEKKWKTKGNKAKVDNLWKKYENGSLSLNETRQAILDLAEGIKDPEWVGRRSNRGTDESLRAPENAQQLPRPELGRQELRPKPRGRVSDTGDVPPEVGRQFMPAGEGRSRAPRPPPQGNRFMAPAAKRVAEEAQLEKFLR